MVILGSLISLVVSKALWVSSLDLGLVVVMFSKSEKKLNVINHLTFKFSLYASLTKYFSSPTNLMYAAFLAHLIDKVYQMCYCCRKLEKLVIFSVFLGGRGERGWPKVGGRGGRPRCSPDWLGLSDRSI